jgi:hypothetical protein
MSLKQNFSDKINNFSTKCTININKNIFFQKNIPEKLMLQKALVSVLKNILYRRNFTNKVRVCRVTLSRRRPDLPDPKYDPESDPKQNIPDPQLWNFSD